MARMSDIRVIVKGREKLNAELDKRFSGRSLIRIVDRALDSGAVRIKRELENKFKKFRATGASKAEITTSRPMTLNGVRTVVIHWRGPKTRHTIIHMNEFGTIKHPNPSGK